MARQGSQDRFIPFSVLHHSARHRLITALDLTQGKVVCIRQTRLAEDLPRPMLARAQAAMGVAHPHLVTVQAAGLCRASIWVATEVAPGETLAEVLRRDGRMPAAEAAGLVLQLLEGLAHLHGLGLAHGGVGTGNILLEDASGPNWLRLGPPDLTGPADPAADLVAAGQVLWACLGGAAMHPALQPLLARAQPFASATAMAEVLRTALRRIGAPRRPPAVGALVRRAKARAAAPGCIAKARQRRSSTLRMP